ncbi:MAG TPA: hypothetical protein DCX53_08790 [Anaerolineae bacterium]|jgi:hypothetical protein|nr:hypothetical protein [Anaerolineae bacterium]
MNASLREIITPGKAQRDVIVGAKHTARILGGWLSILPGSFSVVYIIFLTVELYACWMKSTTVMNTVRAASPFVPA